MRNVLPRSFYFRDAQTVAKELLGQVLVRKIEGETMAAVITETEAYLGVKDPACHSYGDRRTDRTEVMFGPGGHAYIYFIYGMYYMLNAVTGDREEPCAVLIRGGYPLEGLDRMAQNRYQKDYCQLSKAQVKHISDGPGKLCKALNLTRRQNGIDLCDSQLTICQGNAEYTVQAGPRIGVDYAGEAAKWPLNFKIDLRELQRQ